MKNWRLALGLVLMVGVWVGTLVTVNLGLQAAWAAADAAPVAVETAGPPAPAATPDPFPLAAGKQAAEAAAARNWSALFVPLIILLGWVMRQPWSLALLQRAPSKYRGLLLMVTGTLGSAAVLISTGVSPFEALLQSFLVANTANSAYDHVNRLLGRDAVSKLKAELQTAQALTDPKAKDDAVAKILNG